MGEKIIVGPVNRGLRTDREPFNIDDDSFPTMINAYQWRGRVKRKRGTSLLGRLNRFLGVTDGAGDLTVTISPQPITAGIISIVIGTDIFTDQGGASPVTLITNSSGSAVLDRATGVLTILGSKALTPVIYYPTLPVMGLEDLALTSTQFPGTIAFDTTYAYNILTVSPYTIYDISFYKNPATGSYAGGYTQKATPTPLWWNGQNYQQFWSTNYSGAFWTTNGINVPFSPANIGMQFAPASTITFSAATPTTLTVVITNCPLVIGDFVFVNEWTGANAATLNFQSGYVTAVAGVPAALTVTITFPDATIGAGPFTPGIIQYLTNRSDTTKDTIRWYDGDPTSGTIPPTYPPANGWVNFMPPLSFLNYSIADLPQAQYYLVGARMIVPFKDRLVFIGPVVQTSTPGSAVYLQDTVLWSQNGTPFYTASFTGDPTLPTTEFFPILVPINQTATANAYWEDEIGFGGFISVGVAQPIVTASPNEDALIMGLTTINTRFIYTGNDADPFKFFLINSELGSSSTFSIINMDKGVITRGNRGFIITNQTESRRIDLDIPDNVFEMNLADNGPERVTAQRDFINEWCYFTYSNAQTSYTFPNQTLFFNYRDDSWSIFNESYTTYGQFRKQTGLTWQTLSIDLTWQEWGDPWNSGSNDLLEPFVIAGNQQGFVMIREDNRTGEDESLYIQQISGGVVTSPDHCLNPGDYIIITDALGTIGADVNGQIFSVDTADTTTFTTIPDISAGTYLGGGYITRMYVPFIQTKQFPVAWGAGRKTRIGPQQYLLSTTQYGQIKLLIFLSQDGSYPYNDSTIIPGTLPTLPVNNALIYSTVLYTCPESTNLGLTQANTNLQMIVQPAAGTTGQQQVWHRLNTSLIGDTVQIGFSISDDQMRSFIPTLQTFTITGASQAAQVVLTSVNDLSPNMMVQITGVTGMTELNGNIYNVVAADPATITLNVDSTGFGMYISGGTVTVMTMPNQFAEIELHSMILDVNASMVLA